MVRSLLFVGRTKERVPVDQVELHPDLSRYARCFAERGITGALIYADSYLANLIEGELEVIERAVLDGDASKTEFEAILVFDEELMGPRFKAWSLVYAGETEFVVEKVRILLEGDLDRKEKDRCAREVIQMMTLFV